MEEITREEWYRRKGLRMKDGSTYIYMEGTSREGNYSMITLQNKFNPRKGPAAPAHERACTDGTKSVEKNIDEKK